MLQDAVTGNFVTSSLDAPDLIANAPSSGLASWFNISTVTNGLSIQSVVTSQFVTTDPAGIGSLTASRPVPSLWETFTIIQKSGTPDQYAIQAGSNGEWVATQSDGRLINNAVDYQAAFGYRIVGATNPVGQFILQSVDTGLWVTSSNTRQSLVADAAQAAQATPFIFALIFGTPGGSIQSAVTLQYCTSDPSGASPLSAARGSPSTWETFVIRIEIGSPNEYTIQAINNNDYVVSGVNGLVNSAPSVAAASLFRFVSSP